jgi:hypothetical protein
VTIATRNEALPHGQNRNTTKSALAASDMTVIGRKPGLRCTARAIASGAACDEQSVQGPDFWCLDFLPAGHASHGLGDVCTFPFGFLQIQAPPRDLPITDAHDRHPALVQRRSVLLGSAPDPFAPLRLSNDGEAKELGPEVRDALIKLRPILPDLFASAEGSRWMGRLLTSVILIEAGKLTLQVMGIDGLQKALADSFATLLLALTHLLPPHRSAARAHTVEASNALILPSAESLQQAGISRVLEARMSNGRATRQPTKTQNVRASLQFG